MKTTFKAAGSKEGKIKQTKESKRGNKETNKALHESKAFYRNTLDNMLEGCQIIGHDWRYLYLNATAEVHNRRPNQELLGNKYMEVWPGIESTHVFSEIKRCMEERIPVQLENKVVFPDETTGWFSLSIQPVPAGVLVLSIDITERKRAEEEIVWLASFPERNPNPVVEIDSTGTVFYMNSTAQERFPDLPDPGFKHPWLVGLDEAIARFRREELAELHREIQINDSWYLQSLHYVSETARLRVYGTDITERKQAEQHTIQMKRLYATLSQVNQTIVRVKDRDDLYRSICDVAVQFGGFSLAWIGLLDEASGEIRSVAANGLDIGHWPFPVINIHQGDLKNGLVATAIRTSRVVTSEDIQTDQRTQGSLTQIESYSYHSSAAIPFRLRGKTIGVVGLVSKEVGFFKSGMETHLLEEMGLDISFALDTLETEVERQHGEQALRESEERFSKAFYQSPIGIALVDLTDFTIRDVNNTLLEMMQLEREQIVGRNTLLLDLKVDPAVRAAMGQELQEHGLFRNKEIQLRLPSGELRHVLNSGARVMIRSKPHNLALIQDITERKRAEEMLRESEQRFSILFEKSSFAASLSRLPDGVIVNINEAFEKAFGHTKQEAIGKTSLELGINPDTEGRARLLAALNEHGSARNQELALQTKSGETRIFSVNIDVVEIGNQKYLLNTTQDITGQKHAEAQVKYQASLLENINDAVLATDTQFNLTSWNHAAEEVYGYKAEEALGHKAQEIIRSEFSEEQRIAAAQALSEIGSYRTEVLQYHRDGHAFWVEGSTFALKESSGQINGYVSINRDITQRKQAEAQVQRQLKHLNALRVIDTAISSSFDLHVILDIVLQQVLGQLEVDASALLLFHPQINLLEYADSLGFRSDALRYMELRLGEGYASQAVLARKTIHIAALMETDSKLAHALQSANEEFVDYYGTPLIAKGEVKGVLEIYHRSPLKANHEWQEFLETLAGQAAIAIDNAQLFEHLQHLNLQLEQRVVDRTAELHQTNIELEHANRAKDEFLANMSHELRTPLTSILGLSESMLEQRRDPLTEYQQKSIEIIEASGKHLLELINDILDLSKIEAGKFDFYPQPVVVDDICRSSLAFIRAQAVKKSITVTYDNEATVPKIFADPRRLKQILVNLLTNAVKFTPEHGEVILQVNSDVEPDLIHFSVIDNGIGIAPEDLARLFQPFVQVDSSLSRQYEGTGLGLALTQKLTDLHGGSVQVESEVGQGSRFIVNLPCLQEEISKLEKFESQPMPPMTESVEKTEVSAEKPTHLGLILLADDNVATIVTIQDYLEDHGYEVIVAHDGLETIERAEAINPDIILTDIQMPVMNGLEVIARLRENARFADTPIIALTALAMPGDRERCLLAGASEYMSKPVSLKVLQQQITNLMQNRSGG